MRGALGCAQQLPWQRQMQLLLTVNMSSVSISVVVRTFGPLNSFGPLSSLSSCVALMFGLLWEVIIFVEPLLLLLFLWDEIPGPDLGGLNFIGHDSIFKGLASLHLVFGSVFGHFRFWA